MASDDKKLSTTALARKLNIPAQQLFVTLRDYGWIQRTGESWALTPKGEYEGGSYQNSQRYGTYIVWPEQTEQHPLLQAIESNLRITAASMCRYYPPLHARQINRALAELGLQQHTILGWELTRLGRSLGGQQDESASSGAFYVTWPHEIIDHAVIHRELSRQAGHASPTFDTQSELFATPEVAGHAHQGIDGHILKSHLQLQVCNWLYLAQLSHACDRALPTEELMYADFYVPAGNVYVDCWDDNPPVGQLSGKLRQREIYRELELRHLEINAGDVEKLDEVLGRGLLAFGIRC